ncbi:MAG: PucR family transcriptional regulator [Muricoprocola sp.]
MKLSGAYLLEMLEQKRQVEKWEGVSEKEGYLRPFLMNLEDEYMEEHIWVVSGEHIKNWASEHNHLPQKMLLVICNMDEEAEQILSKRFWKKPYIALGGEAKVAEILNDLQKIFDQCEEWKSRLEELTVKNAPMEELLKASVKILGNPVLVMSMDFVLTAEAGLKDVPPQLRLFSESGVNIEQMNALLQDDRFQNMKAEKEPVIFPSYVVGYCSMNLNLFPKDKITHRIVLIENGKEITKGDGCLLKILGYYVEILLNRESMEGKKDDLDNVFWTLMSDRSADYLKISERLEDLGWSAKHEYFCCVLQIAGKEQKSMTSSVVCNYLKRKFPDSSSFLYEENVVCFFNLNKLELDADEVQHRLVPFIRDSFLMAGYSRVMKGHMYLRRQYEQAMIALDVGRREKPYQWVHRFNQAALPYILEQAVKRLPAQMVCEEHLLKLKEMDETHHTDYMLTLRTYLEQNLNATQTANALFIHRSTFLYRLEKIKEILDSNLDDPDEIFYLNLSFRLLGEEENEG